MSPANYQPALVAQQDRAAKPGLYAGVAVLVPCYNEALTIDKVVRDFRRSLPGSVVYVFDNNSSDGTGDLAREAGAVVVRSPIRGKGNVVRHMFSEVDADVYVMVDGDDTYPADSAPALVALLDQSRAGMVVGTRLSTYRGESFRPFHRFGNRMVARLISTLFPVRVSDVLSGYRVFTREFVKSVPLQSAGFEVETELTLQAASKEMRPNPPNAIMLGSGTASIVSSGRFAAVPNSRELNR